jgi:transcription-repair coupling factor (superfamily II helicase)
VFPAQAEAPVRIELVGREIESLRRFDPETQRSVGPTEDVELGPAQEAVFGPDAESGTGERLGGLDLSRCSREARQRFQEELSLLASGAGFAGDHFYVPFLARATLLDHLPPGAAVVVDEESDASAALEEAEREAEAVRRELEERGEIPGGLPLPQEAWREVRAALDRRPLLLRMSRWASDEGPDSIRLPFSPVAAYGGQLRRLVSESASGLRKGQSLAVVSQQAQRLAELFREEGTEARVTEEPPSAPGLALVQGSLPAGWRLSEDGVDLALVTDTEVFGFVKQRRRTPRRGINREAFLAELSPGDYVVHVDHGIARFTGLVRMAVEEHEREYLELHYAEGDKLFVPTDQLDRVSRYVGPSDHEPRLTRLGSGDWQRA